MTPDEKILKITEDTNRSIRNIRADAHAQTSALIREVLLKVLPTMPTSLSELQALAKDAGLTTKSSLFRVILDSLSKEGLVVVGNEEGKLGRAPPLGRGRIVFHKV